jgi:hypothetical protein
MDCLLHRPDATGQDDMALKLNKDDQDWIRNEIKDIVKPSTFWKKVGFWFRQWGVASAAFAGFVGIAIFIFTQISGNSEFRGRTGERLDRIDQSIIGLRALVAASQPERRQNQQAAKELIAEARQKAIPPIPIAVAEETGKTFIRAAASEPNAWGVALDFVNYHSDLKPEPSALIVASGGPGWVTYSTSYDLNGVPGKDQPWMGYVEKSIRPQGEAARAESLSIPITHPKENGIGTFVMRGGALSLDDMHLRHVILVGVEVHYSGARTQLEDVLFVHCRFVMDNNDGSRQLADQILSPNPVTVTLPG